MRRRAAAIFSVTTIVFLLLVSAPEEALGANMRKGPYLINPGDSTQMQVLWQLDQTDPCTLEWGTNTTYGLGNVNTTEYGSDHQHTYTIPNLTPGTKYFYRVTVSGNYFTGTFHAPLDTTTENIKFFAYGDTRTYPASHDVVADGMISTYTLDPEHQTFALVVGDLVSSGREEADWDNEFFDPKYVNIQTMLANLPFHSCMGNHENSGSGGDLFLKYFPYPYVSDHYWSFDYGPAHFVVVDQYVSYSTGSAQLAWIESDLASSTKRWNFICLHEPGWSAGGHSNEKPVQDYIQPLCEKYDVQIVFGGHNHYYARAIKNGVHHVTTGGGGAPLYDPDPSYPNVVAASKSHHFCKIQIEGDILTFSAVKPDGTEIDSFVLDNSILFVDDDNTSGPWYGSYSFPFQYIQDGIDAAMNEGTVSVAPGTYLENIHFQGKAITVLSSGGPDRTIIDGGNPVNPDYGSAVLFDGGEGPESQLQGFTITNGSGTSDTLGNFLGGGIYCIASSPTIRGNIILENTASQGGGISVSAASSPTIINNTLHANTASSSGGGMSVSSDSIPFIAGNTFTENTADSRGGGIDCGSGTPTIMNTILWSNAAPAGPEIYGSNPVVTYCDVQNGWPGTGNIDADPLFVNGPLGLFYLSQPPCQPQSSPCVDAGDPGSTMIEGTTRTDGVQDSGIVDMGYHHLDKFLRVPDDYTTIQAAIDAAVNWDRILVEAGTYVENIDFKGKGIILIGLDGAASTILDGNQAGSTVTFKSDEGPNSILTGFTITNGLADQGGGIYCGISSFPIITENIVSGNSATKDGGGIFGSKTVSNCTISGNDAAFNGGGINGTETIVNSIIQGNSGNLGGGVYGAGSIINSTIHGNSAGIGGGVAAALTSVSIKNTILWNNSAPFGSQIFGSASVAFCDIQGGWQGTGNIDADPLLVDAANGDFHLTYPSPCKDTGDNTAVTELYDFEGDPRIAYGTVDMGADEFYTHLYWTGDATPGGNVEMKFVGLPGTMPVQLWLGSGVMDQPMPTIYGDWFLQFPLLASVGLGSIPSPDGVLVFPFTFPANTPTPLSLPFQAGVGMELTNLSVIEVN